MEREKEGYQKRIEEKDIEIARKRDRSQQIKMQQRQFLQYKALSQVQQQESVTRQYAEREKVQ